MNTAVIEFALEFLFLSSQKEPQNSPSASTSQKGMITWCGVSLRNIFQIAHNFLLEKISLLRNCFLVVPSMQVHYLDFFGVISSNPMIQVTFIVDQFIPSDRIFPYC